MPHLVLTTVGTSTLLNQAEETERRRFYALSNTAPGALAAPDEQWVGALARKATDAIEGGPQAARKASAELNALLAFYENRESEIARDTHVLVATDTACGRLALELLESYLRTRGAENIQRWCPTGFHTGCVRAFNQGVRALLREAHEALPGYRAMGTRVVFNTLGGFKSQRDILNIVGMFYADEILYVFEGPGSPLLRIPRLPIRIDERMFADHAAELIQLAAGKTVGGPAGPVPAWLSDALLDEPDADGQRMLSTWGLLVWNQLKDAVLARELLALPAITYADRFRREFANLPQGGRPLRTYVQEAVAEASVALQESGGNTQALSRRGGLHYSRYAGANVHLGHFRVTNAEGAHRISCEAWPEGKGLRLRRLGLHDDVNGNP